MLGDRTQSAGDQDRSTGEVDADHLEALPSFVKRNFLARAETSASSAVRAAALIDLHAGLDRN
jgi:hypothetical protein